jgi:hypothetical protein
MAHSIVEYKGKHELFGDTKLLLVLHFMVAELARQERETAKALAAEISRVFDGCTPGCLNLPLDKISQMRAVWAEFCPALACATESIRGFGKNIPSDSIESMWQADDGGTWVVDPPSELFVDAALKLARLCACGPSR